MKTFTLGVALLLAAACGGVQAPATTTPDAPQTVSPIPEGFRTLTPVLTVGTIPEAISFYERALGATTQFVLNDPDGAPMHAEIEIGDSILMLSPANEAEHMTPLQLGGTNGSLFVYVEDVDATFERTIAAGGTPVHPVTDMFWGDRYGEFQDPLGHRWSIATHRFDLTDEQIRERAEAFSAAMAEGREPPVFEGGTPAASYRSPGFPTVTLSCTVRDSADLDLWSRAFGAEVIERMDTGDGRIMHAELRVGNTRLLAHSVFEEHDEWLQLPSRLGGTPVGVYMYVFDADASFGRAIAAGANEVVPMTDMFWGDRWGIVADEAGHTWGIASRVHRYTEEQVQENMRRWLAESADGGPSSDSTDGS